MRDDILHSLNLPRLDPPPCPHNIVMGGSEFIKVASCFVTREVQRETARWMSSRKWELGESFKSSKVTKLVSKRANATQIESSLNSRNNPLAWWKERAVACSQKRAEYYFYSTDLGIGLLRMADLKEKFHFWKNRISDKREVAREAGWWRGRLDPEGEVRVPIPVWKQFHPDWFGLEGFSLFKKPQEPVLDPIPSALKKIYFWSVPRRSRGCFYMASSVPSRNWIFLTFYRPREELNSLGRAVPAVDEEASVASRLKEKKTEHDYGTFG